MVSDEGIKRAENRLESAKAKFDTAGSKYGGDANQHPGSVLTHSQRCIELCAKAIFLLMEVEPPAKHVIELDSQPSRNVLNAVFTEFGEYHAGKTARLIFLCELYGSAYPISEYGFDVTKGAMEADEFLDRMEGDQAYNHADVAIDLAEDIINKAQFDPV